MNQLPLAAILVDKVHNNVATTQEAPRDSVVETGVEEVAMVDVNTGRLQLPTHSEAAARDH